MSVSGFTIKELSLVSGYSISTVSKALNNRQDISVSTKNEIIKIAEQHNYRPNKFAVSLRRKRANSIAVILPDLSENCFSMALLNIQKCSMNLGFRTLFYQYFSETNTIYNILNNLNDGSIDGAIIMTNDEAYLKLKVYPIPVVTLNFQPYHKTYDVEHESCNAFNRLLSLLRQE